ncbi:hypothetical protein JCM8202v2_005843 [Rhodotorula sphaerocarpa]
MALRIEVPDSAERVLHAVSCPACFALLVPLQALARAGPSSFTELVVGFCMEYKIQDEVVCEGAVRSQAPILAEVLSRVSTGSDAARRICSTLVEACPAQAISAITLNFTEPPIATNAANVAINESRRVEKRWNRTGRQPFLVVHISDVHIDRQYQVNSSTECDKPMCCRNYGPESVGPQVGYKAGPCDAPEALVESMFDAINQFALNASFTLFTGDVVDHAVWDAGEQKIGADLRTWYGRMPPISYETFGNHDAAPVNSFPTWSSTGVDTTNFVYDIAAAGWNSSISPEAAALVPQLSGCYARIHPVTDLRIISVNSNYWYKQNFWLYATDEPAWDPNGILTWLTSELDQAEQAGQRAWIGEFGHIPPGTSSIFMDQSNYLAQIFNRYRHTIAAHFYGHTHSDSFAVGYSDYLARTAETAIGVAFIGGSLTPMSGNPVFRVYEVDPDTYEIMDFTPYTFDLDAVGFGHPPDWQPYYSARESYGLGMDPSWPAGASLNSTFWHRVTENFEKNDTMYQLFNERMSRGGNAWPCDGDCKTRVLCQLRTLSSQFNCDANATVSEATRVAAVEEACEGPGLGSMLRALGPGGISQLGSSLGSRNSSEHHSA